MKTVTKEDAKSRLEDMFLAINCAIDQNAQDRTDLDERFMRGFQSSIATAKQYIDFGRFPERLNAVDLVDAEITMLDVFWARAREAPDRETHVFLATVISLAADYSLGALSNPTAMQLLEKGAKNRGTKFSLWSAQLELLHKRLLKELDAMNADEEFGRRQVLEMIRGAVDKSKLN